MNVQSHTVWCERHVSTKHCETRLSGGKSEKGPAIMRKFGVCENTQKGWKGERGVRDNPLMLHPNAEQEEQGIKH